MIRYRVYTGAGVDKDAKTLSGIQRGFATNAVESYCAQRFGGVTVYKHRGRWRDKYDETTAEEGFTFEVLRDIEASPERGATDAKDAFEFAQIVREEFNQKCVMVTIENVIGRMV
jgi:hypothetical protein